MKRSSLWSILFVLPSLAAASFSAHADDPVDFRVNAQQEKHNAVVHFSKAAIGQFGKNHGTNFDLFIGVTNDFGGTLPVYVLLKEKISFDAGTQYAEHQGSNHGEAKCDLVQKGNSPDIPQLKLAVLARNCTLISVSN